MLIFQLLWEKNFRLEKLIFLPKKCIYFISYCNEHQCIYHQQINENDLSLNNKADFIIITKKKSS